MLSFVIQGVIPATVAVKDGYCRVGLTEEELNDLAIAGLEKRADKCTSRDLPLFLARKVNSGRWGGMCDPERLNFLHTNPLCTECCSLNKLQSIQLRLLLQQ